MADIRISQLPSAPTAITGTELVPIVQNGLTVQTTVAAITASPSQNQPFLTVSQQPTLPNSRYFSAGTGLGITDGGAQGAYTIAFNGTAASLEASGTGFAVKTAANTITPRSLAVSGNGISVSNGTGISGNPTFSLSGLPLALANASGTGMLAINGSALSPVTITGTSNQIGVANGNGVGSPTISIVNDPVISGNAGLTLPIGTSVQRVNTTGAVRLNSDLTAFEGYNGTSWTQFLTSALASFSAGTTGFTPNTPTTGNVVLAGTLGVANGGTGLTSVTANRILYGNGTGALNASANLTFDGTTLTTPNDASISGFTVGRGGGAVTSNTAFGTYNLTKNTTGTNNTSIGYFALYLNTSGGGNTAYGLSALLGNTVGSNQTAVGYQALTNATTAVATFGSITAGSGYTNGTYTAVSMSAVSGATFNTYPTVTVVVAGGVVSTVTLVTAGYGATSTAATVLTVAAALIGGTGSGFSIPVATFATAAQNTAFGFNALTAVTNGNGNTSLGYQAGSALTTGSNNLILGNTAAASTTTISNEITLGNSSITSFRIPGLSITAAPSALGIGTTTPNVNLEVVAPNSYSVARASSNTGFSLVGAFADDYFSTPTYRATQLQQYSSAATGTTCGIANANLGSLAFQNTAANALIYTNGGAGIIFATLGVDRGRVTSAGLWSLGAAFGSESLRVTPVASAVNYVNVIGAITTASPAIQAAGSDTNINLTLTPKGTGTVTTASQLTLTNASDYNLYASGAGANYFAGNVGIGITSPAGKLHAVGDVIQQTFLSSSGSYVFQSRKARGTISVPTAVVNGDVIGGLLGGGYDGSAYRFTSAIELTVDGAVSASNVPQAIVFSTGTTTGYTDRGRVSSAGIWSLGAAAGSESLRATPVASAVNYVEVFGAITTASPALSAAGSDTNIGMRYYTKGTSSHIFYTGATSAVQFQVVNTVNAVNYITATGNSIGSAPALQLQGADTNISFNLVAKGTGNLNFLTGGGLFTTQFVVSNTTSAVNYIEVSGNVTTGLPILVARGADTNVGLAISSKGTGSLIFSTNSTTAAHFVVAHTASAVNYLQVTGGATTVGPTLSAQGSDTNINAIYATKGTGNHYIGSNVNGYQFAVVTTATAAVNYLYATGAATGVAPSMNAAGSDTNIDLTLIPKGTGVVQYGTYTAGIVAQTGYITIKDAGGTSRRLLVG